MKERKDSLMNEIQKGGKEDEKGKNIKDQEI